MLFNKNFSKNQDVLLSVKYLGTMREVFFYPLSNVFQPKIRLVYTMVLIFYVDYVPFHMRYDYFSVAQKIIP